MTMQLRQATPGALALTILALGALTAAAVVDGVIDNADLGVWKVN